MSHGGGCGCKIAPAMLEQILKGIPKGVLPAELLVGVETGDDAAVYSLNDTQAVVATTDFFTPIVDDPYDFGRIAAANALSDIYAMGGRPIFALSILGMPINKISSETVQAILTGGAEICRQAGIPIAGGHSIDSPEPIFGLAAVGIVHPSLVKRNSTAKKGSALILTKPLGIGILSAALKKGRLSDSQYQEMIRYTTQLNSVGTEIAEMDGVHAMTDVTGFGLGGHLLEICRPANLTANIYLKNIPAIDSVLDFIKEGIFTGASARNFDSYGSSIDFEPTDAPSDELNHWRQLITDPQTNGGLLVCCDNRISKDALKLLHNRGFERSSIIGEIAEDHPETPANMAAKICVHS